MGCPVETRSHTYRQWGATHRGKEGLGDCLRAKNALEDARLTTPPFGPSEPQNDGEVLNAV